MPRKAICATGVRPGNSVWIGQRRYDGTVFRGNIVLQPAGDLRFFELSLHHRMSSTRHEHLAKMEHGEINGNIYYQADAPNGLSTQLKMGS
jgi:hypothetical protein